MTLANPANQNVNPAVTELEHEALAKRGTDNQRQRFAANLLPEDELLAIARAELFKPFEAMRPWHNRNLRPQAVRHQDRMCHGRVDFETCDAADLDHDEWEALAELRRAADIAADHHWVVRSSKFNIDARELVVVEPLTHWATCIKCGAEERRASAKVHIVWAGRVLTREYAL